MIETRIREYLLSNMYAAVYLETPKTMPDECVIFRIVDRSWQNLIDKVTVEFNCYGKSKEKAMELDANVRRLMNAFAEHIVDCIASSTAYTNDFYDTGFPLRKTEFYIIHHISLFV